MNWNSKTTVNLSPAKFNDGRKKHKFNPDRKFVEAAVTEYLQKGGTITKITEISGPVVYGGNLLDNDFDEMFINAYVPESL